MEQRPNPIEAAGRRPSPGPNGSARYRSQEPHHRRRRRTVGAALVVLLVLIVAQFAGGSGSGPRHVSAQPAGFLTRIQALAGTGPGSFTAAQRAAENAGIDRALAITPYVVQAGSQNREIALTFDDGPGPYSPRLLSVLERTHTPGTFFEVGVEERYFHVSTTQIVADGFPIGDHTQSHLMMAHLGAADQESQIVRQISATGAYGAPYPRLYRPPYGSWNQTTLQILRKYRMLMVLWTVDTEDYRQPGIQRIVHTVLSGAQPGAIVLMHDAGGTRTQTIAALPQIISGLRARGYKLVTVPKLLLDNPPSANPQGAAPQGGG